MVPKPLIDLMPATLTRSPCRSCPAMGRRAKRWSPECSICVGRGPSRLSDDPAVEGAVKTEPLPAASCPVPAIESPEPALIQRQDLRIAGLAIQPQHSGVGKVHRYFGIAAHPERYFFISCLRHRHHGHRPRRPHQKGGLHSHVFNRRSNRESFGVRRG